MAYKVNWPYWCRWYRALLGARELLPIAHEEDAEAVVPEHHDGLQRRVLGVLEVRVDPRLEGEADGGGQGARGVARHLPIAKVKRSVVIQVNL